MGRVNQNQKPLRRLAGLFECRIGERHMFSVGAGLARDAGTSFYREEQSAAIAGKPAPTGGWCSLGDHAHPADYWLFSHLWVLAA